jgi:DNA-binding PadR family transcriptional regulator
MEFAPRAGRGDVPLALLLLLAEGARSGYQLMRDVAERSGGIWRPSPGSVYPSLARLERERLVCADEIANRRVFTITEGGRRYLAERQTDMTPPWDRIRQAVPEAACELRMRLEQVVDAVDHLASVGTADQLRKASAELAEIRRAIYSMLGDEDTQSEARN